MKKYKKDKGLVKPQLRISRKSLNDILKSITIEDLDILNSVISGRNKTILIYKNKPIGLFTLIDKTGK